MTGFVAARPIYEPAHEILVLLNGQASQSRQSLSCPDSQSEVDEGSDQNLGLYLQ